MADPERRFTQLDEDVRAIYVMVDDIKRDVRTLRGSVLQQGTRLDQIEMDLQGLSDKVDAIGVTQTEQGRKLDEILALLGPSE